ncbi:hypothetical protein SKAU_G00394680 [Synaphobranchus kaupii]|uniref:Kazal-like domain-containing protein n=1 Tax=Synaphobranchus kaupii TaxID=118154 RepID=A0A9Q1ECB0_SYNKA|nr:hypothetical protein SKAU_G00394680 [Synaphobranchus kaupii]
MSLTVATAAWFVRRAKEAPVDAMRTYRVGTGSSVSIPRGKRLSKGVCQCRQSYKVCGSDGKTYGNVCRLKAVSRKALQRGFNVVTQAHKGPCDVASVAGSRQELIHVTGISAVHCMGQLWEWVQLSNTGDRNGFSFTVIWHPASRDPLEGS